MFENGQPLWEIYFYGSNTDRVDSFPGQLVVDERHGILIELTEKPSSSIEEGEFLLAALTSGPGLTLYSAQINKVIYEDKLRIYLNKPTLVKQVQRRKFLRSQIEKEVELAIDLPSNDYNGKWKSQYFQGKVIDISAGGMLFESRFPWPEQTDFGLSFDLPDLGRIETMAKVVRKTKKEAKYQLGVSFDLADHRDESRLLVYVFRKEKERGLNPYKAQLVKAEVATNIQAQVQILKYKGNYLWQFRDKIASGQIIMLSPNCLALVSEIMLPTDTEIALKFLFPGSNEEIKIEGLVQDNHQVGDSAFFHRIRIAPSKDFEMKIGSLVFSQGL